MFKVKDKLKIDFAGSSIELEIININEYREPTLKYLCDVTVDGNYLGERFMSEEDLKIYEIAESEE